MNLILRIIILTIAGAFCAASCWLVYLRDKERKPNKDTDIVSVLRLRMANTDALWTDNDLLAIYEDRQTVHGVIATCLEQLAMNPTKARQWEQDIKFTHYDYMEMVKYHNLLAEKENDDTT